MKKYLLLALLLLAASPAAATHVSVYNLYAADSLVGNASFTTTAVPIFGADMAIIHWGNRDSTTKLEAYVDSMNVGGVQFSNDGANWTAVAAATTVPAMEVSVPLYVTVNTASKTNNATAPGGRMISVHGYNAQGLSMPMPIPCRYMRFTATVLGRVRRGGTGNAAMYRPFCRAYVYYANDVATPPSPTLVYP